MTAQSTGRLPDEAAREYVNHLRRPGLEKGRLVASSAYDGFERTWAARPWVSRMVRDVTGGSRCGKPWRATRASCGNAP